MALARVKTLDPKQARAMKKTPKAKAVKQIKDDELLRNHFLGTIENLDKDEFALEATKGQIAKLQAEILKAHASPELLELQKEARKLSKRIQKNQEGAQNLITRIAKDLKDGARSLFFALEHALGNRSTKYKEVCEDLVESGKVNRNMMDEFYERHTSRKQKWILRLEDKEINAAIYGVDLEDTLQD